MSKLKDKKILIGITGGIAVYKICSLVNYLIKEGAQVKIVMTESATKFVTPLTFESLTQNKVHVDLWDDEDVENVQHIELAQWPDAIVVAPATANTIAKIAHGIADNLLTVTILASYPETPVLIVPAMNTNMLENPITKQNFEMLSHFDKYHFMETREGKLACGDVGKGKISSTNDIVEYINRNLFK